MAAKPRWLGVMLVTLVMSSVGYYVVLSSPDTEPIDQVQLGQRTAGQMRSDSRSPTNGANSRNTLGHFEMTKASA